MPWKKRPWLLGIAVFAVVLGIWAIAAVVLTQDTLPTAENSSVSSISESQESAAASSSHAIPDDKQSSSAQSEDADK